MKNNNSCGKKQPKTYLPWRYVFAALITLAEIAAVVWLCWLVPLLWIAVAMASWGCARVIILSKDRAENKLPWLMGVLLLPVAGVVLYVLFHSRRLPKKYERRLAQLQNITSPKGKDTALQDLQQQAPQIAGQAKLLMEIADTALFTNTAQTYYSVGEEMWQGMLADLTKAQRFIFLEFYIIAESVFWDSILEILTAKAAAGVEVRVIYDDLGSMLTLPGNYARTLRERGIMAVPFARPVGQVGCLLNLRSHRKLLVVDGRVGYTGGINLADEYINKLPKHGHWKDTGLRLEGEAVWELTRLFLTDYGLTVKSPPQLKKEYFPSCRAIQASGYVIPYGDGPRPVYKRRVSYRLIEQMLAGAERSVYITTPYLIIDDQLCGDIENAALRGVDVRLMLPHIPDKKIILAMSRSYYPRLLRAGVKIYEYTPGFLHAKSCLVDGESGIVGSVNLDSRSLKCYFESAVWMYRCEALKALQADMEQIMEISMQIRPDSIPNGFVQRLARRVARILEPLL